MAKTKRNPLTQKQLLLTFLPAAILVLIAQQLGVSILWIIMFAVTGGIIGSLMEILLFKKGKELANKTERTRFIVFVVIVILLIILLQYYQPFETGVFDVTPN